MALQIDPKQVRSTMAVRAQLDPSWREPLERAAERGKGSGRKADFRTPWRNLPGPAAAYQNEAYSEHMFGAIVGAMPWLLPLLRDAGAIINAWPGCFMFWLPEEPGKGYLIDELREQTLLVPWATAGEQELPQ